MDKWEVIILKSSLSFDQDSHQKRKKKYWSGFLFKKKKKISKWSINGQKIVLKYDLLYCFIENDKGPKNKLADQRMGEPFPYSSNDILRNPLCLNWQPSQDLRLPIAQPPTMTDWSPPPTDTVKWNVDASIGPSRPRSTVGGVLRDQSGIFIFLFSTPIPKMEIN